MTIFEESGYILENRLADFQKSVKTLNRRFTKKGISTVKIEVGEVETSEINLPTSDDGDDHTAIREFVTIREVFVKITWEAELCISGYKLVSALENVEDKIFANNVPKEALLEMPAKIVCDHCGTNRRRRRYAYVLENTETGKQIMVGKQCLRDFLGHDPALLIEAAAFKFDLRDFGLPDDDDYGSSYNRGDVSFGLIKYLSVSFGVIDKYGYVRASDPDKRPTRDRVNSHIGQSLDRRGTTEQERSEFSDISERAKKYSDKIDTVIGYFESITEDANNSYLHNIRNILEMGSVPKKYSGYVVSMPSVWLRHEEKMRAESDNTSEFVGKPKERLRDLQLMVKGVRAFDGAYGPTYLYTFSDETGNLFKWFSSKYAGLETEDEVTLDGTVRNHVTDRYMNNQHVTVLTRCKLYESNQRKGGCHAT